MNKPGPKKLYPHKLPVNFTRDQWDFIIEESVKRGVSMAEIVRMALVNFMYDTIKASHESNN